MQRQQSSQITALMVLVRKGLIGDPLGTTHPLAVGHPWDFQSRSHILPERKQKHITGYYHITHHKPTLNIDQGNSFTSP